MGSFHPLFGQISRMDNALEWGDKGKHFHITEVESQRIGKQQTVAFLSDYLKLPKGSVLKSLQSVEDIRGEYTIRYQHYIQEHKIVGSVIAAHFDHHILTSFNGILYQPIVGEPGIPKEQALEMALSQAGGTLYSWQDEQEEAMLKLWTEDSTATYYPTGQLVYAPKDLDFSNDLELCYAFEINAVEPLIKKNIFIHAQSGELWAIENLIHEAEVKGSANTKYRGVRSIQVDSVSPTNFRLRESGRGKGIETYDMNQGTSYAAAVDFTDTDNYWNNYNANYDEVATDAHFGAEMTYDYFYKNFKRNSFDDKGAKIRSYIHYRKNYVNAFWNGYVMTYGDGNGTSWFPLTSVDICGHEVAHAVTTNSAGLIYSYESGALNESFSDIFGNAVEYFADSTKFNWGMGEDITASGNGIRNMANPNAFRDPDTYKGTYWHTAPSDNGGVHVNSGVQNYWFYLLTKGVSGTNDNGDAFVVDSIGIYKAQQIAYRNLTTYLTPSSNHNEARYYAIQSAVDLYGPCSDEVIATTNAWYAVGVGEKYDSSSISVDFSADTLYCFSGDVVPFSNLSVNTKSHLWSFGDGDTSTQRNPTHTFGAQGKYTVKLVGEGCFLGVKDSIEKTAYIEIDSIRDICRATLPIAGTWTTYDACKGFVYDHGGESNYFNLTRDTVTINFGISDSVNLTFTEFMYEEGYDSLYLYDGPNTTYPLLGGYTGDSLPYGGNTIKITNGAVTLRHFSDQLLNDIGYKAEYEAFRPALSLALTPDTTVCYNQPIWLAAYGSGGSAADYAYTWNGTLGTDSLLITPTADTVIYLTFGDECMQEFIMDSVVVQVRDPLVVNPLPDTTLCYLEPMQLNATAKGGLSSGYVFAWLPTGLDTNNWETRFSQDALVSVVVSDGCTPQNDTTTFAVTVRDSLSHTQNAPSLICQGKNALLTLNPTGGLGVYDYTFSDGTTSLQTARTSWTVSPVASQVHKYWIAYTDQCTPTNDTAFYTLNVRDSLDISLTPDTFICLGQSVTLHAVASGGSPAGYQFDWGRGKSSIDSLQTNPNVTTTYTVQLSDGCSAYEPSKTVTVSLRDPLAVSILGKDTACYGEQITYQAQVTGGDPSQYSYTWNYGDGTAQDYTLPILFSNQKVLVQVSDGCSQGEVRDSIVMAVRPQLQLNIPDDFELCIGKSYTFNISASGGVPSAYQFSWNNGLGMGTQKTVSPTATTTYVVSLTDNCSRPIVGKTRVVVNPLPQVDFEVAPNPSCAMDPINFTNRTPVEFGSTFLWSFGDGNTSGEENPTHAYATAGVYTPALVVTNQHGCVDSLSKLGLLTIIPRPVALFSFSPDVANYYDPDFAFNNASTFATSYAWDFGDGGSSTNANTTYSYADTGYYVVSLTAQNDIGCTDVFSQTVRVEDAFKLFVPSAFSPNKDNLNEQFEMTTRGVKSITLLVFNRWGEILFKSTDATSSWDGTYQGKDVPEGIYYYTLYGVDFRNESFQDKGNIMLFR